MCEKKFQSIVYDHFVMWPVTVNERLIFIIKIQNKILALFINYFYTIVCPPSPQKNPKWKQQYARLVEASNWGHFFHAVQTYQRQGWSPCEGKISTDPPRGHPSWPPCTKTSWCYLKSSGQVKILRKFPYKFYQNITFILQIQKVQHKLACIIKWKMFSFQAKDGLMVELHAI